ncbi:MAG TPA: aquaporin [Edaphobacter sp.]|nr:aquaporin [Edaphobacter sp.]
MTMQPCFPVTNLPATTTAVDAITIHWREYLMESVELCALMFSICLSGTLIYSKTSPLSAIPESSKSFLMGGIVAGITLLIIRSPFGRRTGAHLNPALTLTYFFLGRIHHWDTIFYILSQFAGAVVGVFLALEVLGGRLSAPPVCYVITIPGRDGRAVAFLAEILLSSLVMGVILFTTNRVHFVNSAPFFVTLITFFYYGFCSSLSGFSVNPARSFSSALFASVWEGIWIYFLGPSFGMLAAALIYIRVPGKHRVYCAKVFHDMKSPCPFRCDFMQLVGKNVVDDDLL